MRNREQTWNGNGRVPGWVGLITAGSLALTACSPNRGNQTVESTTAMSNTASTSRGVETVAPSAESSMASGVTSLSTTEQPYVEVTFDALGGGDPTIDVYPGVSTSTYDRTHNGTFKDKDVARAICKVTNGRAVSSRPDREEKSYHSKMWVEVVGNPGRASVCNSGLFAES